MADDSAVPAVLFFTKTFWLNLLGPFFAWLAAKGIAFDPDTQMAIVMVVMAVGNIILRRFTRRAVTVLPTSPTT